MIFNVKKYLFIGVKEDLDLFFSRAQHKGAIQFIKDPSAEVSAVPKYIENIAQAIKVLKSYHSHDTMKIDEYELTNVVDDILRLHKKKEMLQEELIHIEDEIEKMRPLGEFSMEDLNRFELLSNKKILFFSCKRGYKDHADFPEELIYLTTDHDLDYFIYIGERYPEYSSLSELQFSHALSEWKERREHWRIKIRQTEQKLKEYAPCLEFLKKAFLEQLSHVHLVQAKQGVSSHLEGSLFAIDGWVPEKRLSEVAELSSSLGIHFEEVAIEAGENKPTYMENNNSAKIGEDLVHIYDTPSPNDKDPSKWVLWGFTVFFAIIIADAGYGLIFLALALLMRFKLYQKAGDALRRFIKLFLMLSTASIIWGVLTCSYFSIEISPENPLSRYSLLSNLVDKKAAYHMAMKDDVYEEWIEIFPSIKDATSPSSFVYGAASIVKDKPKYEMLETFKDDILMEFSLLIGTIHVILSFLRNLRKNLAGLGLIAFMIGGYLFLPSMLNATSLLNFTGIVSKEVARPLGIELLGGGVVVAIITSLIQNKWKGLAEVVTSIQIFADVLSYVRLYALGLASMILASTFNELGESVGLVGGVLIALIGHSINITIGIMGGVIHGLRLNFLEWYHYSFEGGGKMFNPLRILK